MKHKRVIYEPPVNEEIYCYYCNNRLLGQPKRIYTNLECFIEIDTEIYCRKCKKWIWVGESNLYKYYPEDEDFNES